MNETMFQTLNDQRDVNWCYSCTVGKKPSAASNYLNDHTEVSDMLSSLVLAGKSIPESNLMSNLGPRKHPPTPTINSFRRQNSVGNIPEGYKLVPIGDEDSDTDDYDEGGLRRTYYNRKRVKKAEYISRNTNIADDRRCTTGSANTDTNDTSDATNNANYDILKLRPFLRIRTIAWVLILFFFYFIRKRWPQWLKYVLYTIRKRLLKIIHNRYIKI